jgi:glycerol-1-phosphate dehydrogenase [NAD(P)+]
MERITASGHEFTTIFGRNLVGELKNFVHYPYLVVTMSDLWDKFKHFFDDKMVGVYFVTTLDGDELEQELVKLPFCNAIIGLGGGQAIDIAKYFAWRKRLPIFQVPTSMTVDAPFGHRCGLRFGGNVRYIGYAVPEAVYVDFDVIQSAPALLNRSGICEIMCYHTAHADWRLSEKRGKTEAKWRYDQRLVDEAQHVLQSVMTKLDDIRDVSETGIRTLMNAYRFGGATYHNAGWNPRHIEGTDHFLFYALEYYTGKKFIHGQPVCLGIVVGSMLHDDRADEMLNAIHHVGVDIRPESMGITWDDVAHALKHFKEFVHQAGLWYSIAHEATIDDGFISDLKTRITTKFGAWNG